MPYSQHLKYVEGQGVKFIKYFSGEYVSNKNNNFRSKDRRTSYIVQMALIAHDSIEDARLTYNDLLELVNTDEFGNYLAAKMVADAVYCVTDEKGKSRKERKNSKYYHELRENRIAVFVKLSDLAANTLYSKLSGSSMYEKYKKEFPNFKEMVYREEFKEFFDYIENI